MAFHPVLKIEIQESGQTTVVRCAGRVVYGEEANSLQRTVLSLKTGHIVIDLSQVEEMDAGGLGALVVLQRWANDSNRTLRLLNPSPRLHRALEITGLNVVLDISSQPQRSQRSA